MPLRRKMPVHKGKIGVTRRIKGDAVISWPLFFSPLENLLFSFVVVDARCRRSSPYMTEYAPSAQMVHEFMNSRDRTARWVQTHVPYNGEFYYSPSVPPTDYVPSRPPSEAESSRSTPPKMVLRYNDGRKDIPIYHANGGHGLASSRGSEGHSPRHGRSRGDHHGRAAVPVGPEQIRILPATSGSRHGHNRSKSLPRHADYDRSHEAVPTVPHLPSQHSSRHGSRHRGSPTQHKVTFAPPAQPTQPWHRPKQLSTAGYPQYSPQMYTHPHQAGPNGVIYSHSAPTPGYYPPQYMPPVHHTRRRTMSVNDRRGSSRHPAAESAESLGTDTSGTYVVLQGPHGEKVHVIVSVAFLDGPAAAF